jgi:hypothetical protein
MCACFPGHPELSGTRLLSKLNPDDYLWTALGQSPQGRPKYFACFSLHPQTRWVTLCITSDCHGMIISNQTLMFTCRKIDHTEVLVSEMSLTLRLHSRFGSFLPLSYFFLRLASHLDERIDEIVHRLSSFRFTPHPNQGIEQVIHVLIGLRHRAC